MTVCVRPTHRLKTAGTGDLFACSDFLSWFFIWKMSAYELFHKEVDRMAHKQKLALKRFSEHLLALYQSLRNVHNIMPAELLLVTPACIKWTKQLNIGDPRYWQQDLMKTYGRPSEFDIYTLQKSPEMKKIKSCKRERVLKAEIEKLLITEFSQAVAATTEFIVLELNDHLTSMNPFVLCQELMTSMSKKFDKTHSIVMGAIDYRDPLNYNVGGIGRRMRKFLLFRIQQLILLAQDCNCNQVIEPLDQVQQAGEVEKLFQQFNELTRPVANFSKITQQFDTKSMIEIFADLNHSPKLELEQGQVRMQSQSRLPTALVKIVNNYCELDPLSSADDQLIARNLLQ